MTIVPCTATAQPAQTNDENAQPQKKHFSYVMTSPIEIQLMKGAARQAVAADSYLQVPVAPEVSTHLVRTQHPTFSVPTRACFPFQRSRFFFFHCCSVLLFFSLSNAHKRRRCQGWSLHATHALCVLHVSLPLVPWHSSCAHASAPLLHHPRVLLPSANRSTTTGQ